MADKNINFRNSLIFESFIRREWEFSDLRYYPFSGSGDALYGTCLTHYNKIIAMFYSEFHVALDTAKIIEVLNKKATNRRQSHLVETKEDLETYYVKSCEHKKVNLYFKENITRDFLEEMKLAATVMGV